MPHDTYLLIGLGCVALLVVWLVFSLVKKVLGLVLLAALAFGLFMVWNNPSLLNHLVHVVSGFLGAGR